MTIFFGVYGLNETDGSFDLSIMLESLSYNSTDTHGLWSNEGVAFGQKTVFNTPESFSETLPFYDPVNKLAIAGDIRIDNRTELCSKINIDPKKYTEQGDSSLVILAYRKWGESLCEHLLGDFAFVLWDGDLKKLICCTDHLATRSFFYFSNGKKFVFASTPNPILALSDVPTVINENKLSTMIFPGAKNLFWGESWFKDVLPLQAATVMTIDNNGIKKRVYWAPDATKELLFKSEAEFTEAFKAVLFKAVGDRMRSRFPVTALLSGGLDSSAIVSVAAKILEGQNRELQVFSSVLPEGADPVLTDERYYIDQFKNFPNVKINYITAPGKGFFSDLDELQTAIYTPNLIGSHYLGRAFATAARHYGSRVLLDGGGGEMGISYHGTGCYAELFRKLQWLSLWHELLCRKKVNGEPPLQTVYNDVIKPLIPREVLKRIRTGYSDGTKTHFLQQDVVNLLTQKLHSRKQDIIKSDLGGVSSFHRVNQANAIRMVQMKAHGKPDLGDVEVGRPLLDKSLLEFCLAAPINFKVKNGYKRYMVRAGLDGLLPPEIQWRTTKGPFSPDYRTRYNTQLPQVRAFLEDIGANDPVRRIVDVEKLKLWTSIDSNSRIDDKMARDQIPQSIYLIHFLRRFPEYQK